MTETSPEPSAPPVLDLAALPRLRAPRTLFDSDLATAELHAFLDGVAAVFSARAPGKAKTEPNEDSVAILPYDETSGVLAVADGAGGMPAGEVASRLALETLVATVEGARSEQKPLRDAILDGIEAANRAVLALGTGSGTTIAVAEVQGSTIRSYHVGDSVLLVTGQRGRVKLQTMAHSPVGYALESGLLNEAEAVHHEERHVVSNLLGTSDMRIELGPAVELSPRDSLLIASDGLFDNLYFDEIVQQVRKGPLDQLTATLAARCHERMRNEGGEAPSHADDLSFVVFRLS